MVEINWHVVNNGLDFLESAVELLGSGGAREVKYAALHLSASIETLLKVRLAREHWTLVVADPREAQRTKYEAGDFKSATIDQALDRLAGIANVAISEKDRQRITSLNRTRNQIAHFALIGDNPLATRATVARAMEALLRFIEKELAPGAPDDERELINDTYASVMERIREIEVMVRERMKSLKPVISQAGVPVVKCPECLNEAYLFADGEPGSCLFCAYRLAGVVAADDYASNVLGESEYATVKDGGEWIVGHCHICADRALVDGIVTTGSVKPPKDAFLVGTTVSGASLIGALGAVSGSRRGQMR
ncbi:hypothetical protein E1267_02975 [Nonomuraea longispora]|uniref:DUF4145 domain-containing protein n=1 Tax=Nonomuraea longispora TaxID=1848320 RepID=A0A4R4NRX3_9ACTN|nr:HAD-IA family hydrolase [Nonomuraea longispora]TDC10720.1 hypothetical protein E1267_02975 [Nonomuraea longispora]